MGKETVRYPDALVARIEDLVADSDVFESKSELHRFASDFFLSVLDPDHDSSVLGYDDILRDLEDESGVSLQPDDVATSDADTSFLESYLRVRRFLLHGEIDDARAYVAETYDISDREALLLDELIGRHREETTETRQVVRPPQPQSRPPDGPNRMGRFPHTDPHRGPDAESSPNDTNGASPDPTQTETAESERATETEPDALSSGNSDSD